MTTKVKGCVGWLSVVVFGLVAFCVSIGLAFHQSPHSPKKKSVAAIPNSEAPVIGEGIRSIRDAAARLDAAAIKLDAILDRVNGGLDRVEKGGIIIRIEMAPVPRK